MDRAETTPVLHFVDYEARARFLDALGATTVAVEPLVNVLPGAPDVPDDVNMVTYVMTLNDQRVFCALQQLPDSNGMCHSASTYNAWFANRGYKKIMSVDPTGVQARTQPSAHHENCEYVWTVSRLYRYMDIREEHVQDVHALTEAIVVRRPVDRVITRIRAGDFFELFADNISRRYPVPEPRDEKVELDERITKRLKTEDELHKATDDYYACVACMEYDKGVVLFPCNHVPYCDKCFKTMLEKTSVPKTCPLCREDVKDWISIKF